MNYIGNNIRRERLKHGLSQENLADEIGMDQSAISKIENGINDILFNDVITIVNALNIDIDLITHEHEKNSDLQVKAPPPATNIQFEALLHLLQNETSKQEQERDKEKEKSIFNAIRAFTVVK